MTQTPLLDTHIITPQQTPVGSVIWMHGLGADNRNFDCLVPELSANHQLPLRFIFPNAPIRPVSINQNMPMRAWYDVYSLTDLNHEDKASIVTSQHHITQLIAQEIKNGIPAHRIVIAGFSQGGAMALYTGVRHTQKLAGILALSSYLPLFHEHEQEAHLANKDTPIFIAHGTQDATLPCFAGKMAFDIVQQTHAQASWHEYEMMHEITPQETRDIAAFLIRVFA